jgi:lactate permease
VYQQVLDPVAHSLAWSSLVAAIPLLLLFVLLGVFKVTAWVASLISLAVAIAVAVLVYGMPIGQTLLAGTEGAAFGFFPILWIVINAIWVYQQTVETGRVGDHAQSPAALTGPAVGAAEFAQARAVEEVDVPEVDH